MASLPLWLIAGSLALNAIFLRRLLEKLDRLYEYIVGTPDKAGLADRVRHLESMLDIQPADVNRRRPPLETPPLTKDSA